MRLVSKTPLIALLHRMSLGLCWRSRSFINSKSTIKVESLIVPRARISFLQQLHQLLKQLFVQLVFDKQIRKILHGVSSLMESTPEESMNALPSMLSTISLHLPNCMFFQNLDPTHQSQLVGLVPALSFAIA